MRGLPNYLTQLLKPFRKRKKAAGGFSPKLRMWYEEAHAELGLPCSHIDPSFGIFPRVLVDAVAQLDHSKIYDFCFVGAYMIDEKTRKNREWVPAFVRDYFSNKSYLQFTDRTTKMSYTPMGDFDFTLKKAGFVPKENVRSERNFFDKEYYQVMCGSKFTLCPAGDNNWSIRFYEALMCKSIPILPDRTVFRTEAEKKLDYEYYVLGDVFEYSEAMTEKNYQMFLRHHTLRDRLRNGGTREHSSL